MEWLDTSTIISSKRTNLDSQHTYRDQASTSCVRELRSAARASARWNQCYLGQNVIHRLAGGYFDLEKARLLGGRDPAGLREWRVRGRNRLADSEKTRFDSR
jgi:hypothetical protein